MNTQAQILEAVKADREYVIDRIKGMYIGYAFPFGIRQEDSQAILKSAMNKFLAIVEKHYKGDVNNTSEMTWTAEQYAYEVSKELKAEFPESISRGKRNANNDYEAHRAHVRQQMAINL